MFNQSTARDVCVDSQHTIICISLLIVTAVQSWLKQHYAIQVHVYCTQTLNTSAVPSLCSVNTYYCSPIRS